jgi:hypothetical protein
LTTHSFTNPETGKISITDAFGENLALLLSQKITSVTKRFDSKAFCSGSGKSNQPMG